MSDEFDYFRDRHLGKLLDLVLQLSTDLHVANQRLHGLEALLVRHDVLSEGELDSLVPDEAERRTLEHQRDAMMNRLMRIIAESGPAEHPLRDQWEAALAAKAG